MNNEKREAIVWAVEYHKGVWPCDGDDSEDHLYKFTHGTYVVGIYEKGKFIPEPICNRDVFEQVAREMGYINGYKWGVEYPTNGKRPDLPDDVVVEQKFEDDWVGISKPIAKWVSWDSVNAFKITDGRRKPKSTSKPEVDNWYERGELPPLGEVVEYFNNGKWVNAVLVFKGKKRGMIETDKGEQAVTFKHCLNNFRPIQSHREKTLANAEHAIESRTGQPANSTHLGILYDIGALKLPEDNE